MTGGKIYYLWGDESYLIDRKIEAIIDGIRDENGDEPEVVPVDADEMSALELGQTLEFSPLFALSRVVVIKRPVWLGKSVRKLRKIEESLQVLQDYCRHDNHGQVLIMTSAEYSASNPVAKFLAKNAEVVNVKAPGSQELEDWCQNELERRNVRVNPAARNRMANSGQDMYYLVNLMDKLSLIRETDVIGVKEMEEQLDSKQEIKVFKLTDALLNRNPKASLAAFYQLQEQGMHHLLLLNIITRQYLTMSKVKFYHEDGYPTAQIAQATGQKDFVIKKMLEKASKFPRSEIRKIFIKLLETDISLKSESKDPRILMETLLVDLCG